MRGRRKAGPPRGLRLRRQSEPAHHAYQAAERAGASAGANGGRGAAALALGPLLYQLPPNFRRTQETARRLEAFLRALPPRYRHVLEFRHESWFVEETFAALKRRRAGFCIFDMPGRSPRARDGPLSRMCAFTELSRAMVATMALPP